MDRIEEGEEKAVEKLGEYEEDFKEVNTEIYEVGDFIGDFILGFFDEGESFTKAMDILDSKFGIFEFIS